MEVIVNILRFNTLPIDLQSFSPNLRSTELPVFESIQKIDTTPLKLKFRNSALIFEIEASIYKAVKVNKLHFLVTLRLLRPGIINFWSTPQNACASGLDFYHFLRRFRVGA